MKIFFIFLIFVTAVIFLEIAPSSMASQKNNASENFSLFYSEAELIKQEQHVDKSSSSQILHKIHLKALFYSSPEVWTLWINNIKISSTESHSLYRVIQITVEFVILDWWYEGNFHRVQLRPNQSFDVINGHISEGCSS